MSGRVSADASSSEPRGVYEDGPTPVDKPRWLVKFGSMSRREKETLLRQRCERQVVLGPRDQRFRPVSGSAVFLIPTVALLSIAHTRSSLGMFSVVCLGLAVTVLFAYLAGAACEVIDRACRRYKVWRWDGQEKEAAALDALMDRVARLGSEIDDYNRALREATPGSPYRSALEGRLGRWRDDLALELGAVGTSVNDLLAGT